METMKELIIIKIGGVASQSLTQDFLEQVARWKKAGKDVVIVHGGGFAITAALENAGIESRKVNGQRVTELSHLPYVEEALVHQVGVGILSQLSAAGLSAHQVNLKATVLADFLDKENLGYVGQATAIDTAELERLLTDGTIPLLASLGYTADGQLLNINADYLATAVATSLKASQLILMTDVPGVLEDGQVISQLTLTDIDQKIADGIVVGGMIPKLESAAQTVQAGVGTVIITDKLIGGTKITGGAHDTSI